MKKIDTSMVTVNTTIADAEKTALTAVTAFATAVNQTIVPLLTKYSAYGVDISLVAETVTGISDQLADAKQILQTVSVDRSAITQVLAHVAAINQTLNAAADNMTTLSLTGGKNSATCLTKYGKMLSAAPVSVDRINTCITSEITPIKSLATNVTTIFSLAQTIATQMLSMINICLPTPNRQCIEQFYGLFGDIGYNAINILDLFQGFSALFNTITFRLGRCSALVSADVSVLSATYTDNFVKCLTTGS
ncbi:uncharacterized protein LOC128743866 [Sabethes cyaneus]|uniref:uncharacterized protein LOC128743866 n=1 Tax=Sabethes cyaneus TaxID=53552 RepID=UPI00237DECDD|nr:uncharacterized protein LOC128743866 [Sabethes cyaneus]